MTVSKAVDVYKLKIEMTSKATIGVVTPGGATVAGSASTTVELEEGF